MALLETVVICPTQTAEFRAGNGKRVEVWLIAGFVESHAHTAKNLAAAKEWLARKMAARKEV